MIGEGTRGPFYTIGRFSFRVLDTWVRQLLHDSDFHSTEPFLHYGVERRPVCLIQHSTQSWLGLIPYILEARAALLAFCRVTERRLQR